MIAETAPPEQGRNSEIVFVPNQEYQMNSDDKDRIEIGHISKHGIQGSEGTHEISQRMEIGGGSFTAFTDVGPTGEVGESGFDSTTKDK